MQAYEPLRMPILEIIAASDFHKTNFTIALAKLPICRLNTASLLYRRMREAISTSQCVIRRFIFADISYIGNNRRTIDELQYGAL